MPLVDITYSSATTEQQLLSLARTLPHAVSVAVECLEEPYDGDLKPGDVDLRFHARERYDSGGLDIVVDVRSRWYPSRVADLQERSDGLLAQVVAATGTTSVGVYLGLPVAGWAQGQ